MIKTKKCFFVEHKYTFAFFFLIVFTIFIQNGARLPEINDNAYSFYAVDFRIGIIPNVLQGQIFNWIVKNPSKTKAYIYLVVLLIVAVFMVSYLLEKLFLSSAQKYRKYYAFIICLFCVSGTTFYMYYVSLGMLDFHWMFAFLFFLFFLQNKKTRVLIPLCYIFMVFVHFGALCNYIPLMSIILLYEISRSNDKNEKRFLLIIFAISVVVTFGAFGLLSYNFAHNVKMMQDEIHKMMSERGCNYFGYYDYVIYNSGETIIQKQLMNSSWAFLVKNDKVPNFIKEIIYHVFMNVSIISSGLFVKWKIGKIISVVLTGIPFLGFFFVCIHKLKKSTDGKLKKFALFCMIMLFPFSFITSMMQSVDESRFFGHSITCIFICVFYLLYVESNRFGEAFSERIKRTGKEYLALFTVCAFLFCLHPYF